VIKKGTVRASHAYYLNDFREITHGKTLILEWYKSKKDKVKSKDTLTYFHNEFIESIEISISISKLVDQPFVACFSGKQGEDLLSQWQSYGRSGLGYSLGFSPKEIKNNCSKARLFKVIYKEKQQQEIVKQTLKNYTQELEKILSVTSGPKQNECFGDFRHSVAKFIHICMCCFKHFSWEAEHEYRLLLLTPPFDTQKDSEIFKSLEFGSTELGAIKPYLDISITEEIQEYDEKTEVLKRVLPLKKIIVGSKVNLELAENSLNLLLERYNYAAKEQSGKDVVIIQSKLSLR
jgi:hypothetical protein